MKKASQNKKTKTNDVSGITYNLVYKVSIPPGESDIDTRAETVTNYVVSALEAVSKEVKGIKLKQYISYESDPVSVPILERHSDG